MAKHGIDIRYTISCPECGKVHYFNDEYVDDIVECSCGFEFYAFAKDTLRIVMSADEAKLTDHSITTDTVQNILDEIDRTEFRLTEYDDSLTRRFIERIDIIDKHTVKITFIGGYQTEQAVE